MEYRLYPFSDHGIIIDFGNEMNEPTMQKIQAISKHLEEQPFPWMVEFIPAFTTLAIYYNPHKVAESRPRNLSIYEYVHRQVHQLLRHLITNQPIKPRVVEIPVCYGGSFGPDLEFVALYHKLTQQEVIKIHSNCDYLVHMIGFAPGFPYIGGMAKRIATPRKNTPRLKIPAGSVGIAGNQTGIYPIETPGGWQLIGRTPLKLFNLEEKSPSLLQAGDKVKFLPITEEEFFQLEVKKR